MATYTVTYYIRTSGRLLACCDRNVPWDAILTPLSGTVARCESNFDHSVTWIDAAKARIPAPAFA